MNTVGRLAIFTGALIAVFAIAFAAGSATDGGERQTATHPTGHQTSPANVASAVGGLAIASDKHRLVPEATTFEVGVAKPFVFRIASNDGTTVKQFDMEQDKRMHMILVRRDLIGYQHLHPVQQEDGSWSVTLTLDQAGPYRVFADFTTSGERSTLGTDLFVAGDFNPAPLPAPSASASVDGYEVSLEPQLVGEVSFTVRRNGIVVNDLEPYLGARGHLVVLREGDLGYLHVHPEEDVTHGAGVEFMIDYPSSGRYRLFLQFQHGGRVHTAAFTQEAGQ